MLNVVRIWSLFQIYTSNGMVESANDPSESSLPFVHKNRVSCCWAPGCTIRFRISLAAMHVTHSNDKSGP